MEIFFQLFVSEFGRTWAGLMDAAAARAQLGLTSTGSAVATAADPAAARTALELGTMAAQNANAVAITGGTAVFTGPDSTSTTTGSVRGVGAGFTGNVSVGGNLTLQPSSVYDAIDAYLGPNAILLANNAYSGGNRASALSGRFCDRMFGATARYNFTSSGFTTPENAFNKSQDSFAVLPAGQTGIIEFELQSNGSSFISYAWGLYFATFHFSYLPASYKVELQTSNSVWRTVRDISDPQALDIFLDSNTANISITRIRITVVAAAGAETWLSSFEFFPKRPRDTELQQFLPIYSASQLEIFSPALAIRGINRDGAQTTIGPGTLHVNNLPTYADHAAANAALSVGDFYQVSGSQLLYSKASTAAVVVNFSDGSTLAPNANGDLVFTSKNNNTTTMALA